MLDHISGYSTTEQELSQHILLQAISSLDNILQTSSISPTEADSTARRTQQVIRSLGLLNKVLFRSNPSCSQKKERHEVLPESLSVSRTVNTTPPPGYSPDFKQDVLQDRVAEKNAEMVNESNVQEVCQILHPAPGEQIPDVYLTVFEPMSSSLTRTSSYGLDVHASSPSWFDIAALFRSIRSFLEIKYETVPACIPRFFIEQIAWEMKFQIQRPASTNSIWNLDYQEAARGPRPQQS
ncbi:MAG: hypothetical protein CL912_30185 [Deltaproteobacteria bacterium]|nr:hypothetical protein [Deltaproteobacteria bacterium]